MLATWFGKRRKLCQQWPWLGASGCLRAASQGGGVQCACGGRRGCGLGSSAHHCPDTSFPVARTGNRYQLTPSAKLNSLSQSDLKSGINDPASHPLWRHWMAQGAQAPHCSPCLALFNFRKRLLIGQMTFKSLWRKGVPPCGSFSIQTFMLYQMDKGLPPALRV